MFFFFIFGVHKSEKDLSEPGRDGYQCGHCGNRHQTRIRKYRDWFSLCWVPLIPISGSHTELYCGICGTYMKIPIGSPLYQDAVAKHYLKV